MPRTLVSAMVALTTLLQIRSRTSGWEPATGPAVREPYRDGGPRVSRVALYPGLGYTGKPAVCGIRVQPKHGHARVAGRPGYTQDPARPWNRLSSERRICVPRCWVSLVGDGLGADWNSSIVGVLAAPAGPKTPPTGGRFPVAPKTSPD
jgi:hypothetical protein